jgi:muramoyltetrapeptide carboxypeptidase
VTLLIDPPNSPGHGRMWSHLASDTSYDELHRFAATLGIPTRGFDRDHYDIPAERYDEVVAAGATPVSSRELIVRLKAAGLRRRKAETLAPKPPGRSLIRAERLRPGARVAVVAPAGPVPDERLDLGVARLRDWGLDVVVGDHVRGSDTTFPYLAAGDAARAADLMRAWCDPGTDAVLCARGGYGVQRVLDLLDWEALAAAGPKVLVGFSDVTALHQVFGSRLGLSTLHGPVVAAVGDGDEASRAHLRTMLFDPAGALLLTPDPCEVLVGGEAEGVLTGGNVSLLASQAGTWGAVGAAGCIAMLEEVGEEPYRLDRLLTQLIRSGWFDDVRGIVVGQLTDCGPADVVRSLLVDRLGPLGVPLLAGAPFGHGQPNLAFPCGVPAKLDGGAGTLTLRAPALL